MSSQSSSRRQNWTVFVSVLLLLGLCLQLTEIHAVQNATLQKIGYNYVAEIVIDSTESYPLVMDTGSSELLTYNRSYNDVVGLRYSYCLSLSIDSTPAQFASQSPYKCTEYDAEVRLGPVLAEDILVSAATSIGIGNPYLHQWYNNTAGVFGLSYNQSCYGSSICGYTSFQELLINATVDNNGYNPQNLTFGLDFRNANSSIASIASENSTIQMGGVKPEFENSIAWLAQPQSPDDLFYHLTFMENLQMCGANLLGNYSTNWGVIIDTGSSCMTLPGEIYDNLVAWLDTSKVIQDLADLPALSFQLNTVNGSQSFYIPLGILAVDYHAIVNEAGAPIINYQGSYTSKRLCVLRGGDIESGDSYSNPPSTISFGSLVLQSIYFAADFTTGSVGFANKLSPAETAAYSTGSSNSYCKASSTCIGQQTYSEGSNTCNDPNCEKYFFVTIDQDRKVCVYKTTSMNFGIIFVSIIIAAEVIAYLIQQYSGFELVDRHRDIYQDHGVNGQDPQVQRYRNFFQIDMLTFHVARWIVRGIDILLLKFARRPDPNEDEARGDEGVRLNPVGGEQGNNVLDQPIGMGGIAREV